MIDGNKLYLKSPWTYNPRKVIVGVGEEVLAFGRVEGRNVESFIHFRKEDWKKIKKFVDERIK